MANGTAAEAIDAIATAFKNALVMSLSVPFESITLGTPVTLLPPPPPPPSSDGSSPVSGARRKVIDAPQPGPTAGGAAGANVRFPFTVSVGAQTGASSRVSAVAASIVAATSVRAGAQQAPLQSILTLAGVQVQAVATAAPPTASTAVRVAVFVPTASKLAAAQTTLADAVVAGGAVQVQIQQSVAGGGAAVIPGLVRTQCSSTDFRVSRA